MLSLFYMRAWRGARSGKCSWLNREGCCKLVVYEVHGRKSEREQTILEKRHYDKIIIGVSIAAVAFMLIFNIFIFKNYQSNLISMQENHMMTTAKAVANNLENYYNGELNNFSVYFEGDMDAEKALRFFHEQPEISSICVIGGDGTRLLYEGNEYGMFLDQAYTAYREKGEDKAALLSPVLTSERHYTQFMAAKTRWEGADACVIASMEMESIYNLIVRPIKIGQYGYSMVKNYDGTILMHKSVNQIGIDAVEGRKAQYSEYDLDLSDLESWVEQQRTTPEGSRILNSYWWEDGKEPVKTKKVVAYTQASIGKETWIINSTLDYNEIYKPLVKTRWYVFCVSVVTIGGFGILLAWIINNANQNKTMELEMKHLLEMNSAWEELHKREEQIRHNDKIRTLGTMTSMISHEFNNFLTPVMLYGDMLLEDPDINEENKGCLAEMVAAAHKAKDLTKELSRYGHSGTGSGKKMVLHVVEEINRSLAIIKKTLPDNITLTENLQPDDGYGLMGSSGMVNQVIVNLCTNAVYAMQEKGGSLTVKGIMLEEEGHVKYAVTVSDTGPGMPEETLNQIFTPFYTTKESGSGTGLGLSVVQDLIHQVSGEINVVSVEGKGTRFDIVLPLFRIEESCRKDKKTEGLKDLCIFILDDNEKVSRALHKSLKPLCKKTSAYTHPEEALAAMKKELSNWDAVITDYSMPVMNGLEFSGILRSLGYSKTIVLISGNLNQDVQWYLDHGIVDFVLEKPVSVQEIEELLSS